MGDEGGEAECIFHELDQLELFIVIICAYMKTELPSSVSSTCGLKAGSFQCKRKRK